VKQLYVLLIFIALSVHSQAQANARLFEDYTKCYTGFLSAKGDTIWPAQFEQVHAMSYNEFTSDYCWVAKYKGYYGVIDRMGKNIVPFAYEEIAEGANQSEFIFHKNGKVGLVSRTGTVLVEGIYDEIEIYPFDNRTYYHVKKDLLVGLMNEVHRLLFPLTYRQIHQLDNSDETKYEASNYIIAYDTAGAYLIDTLGNKIIKEKFHEIQQERIRLGCDTWTYCFLTYDTAGNTNIYDAKGRKLSNESYDDVYFNTVYLNGCSTIGTYAVCKSPRGKELLNVTTGQRSKVYADLTFLGNYHVYSNKKINQGKKTIFPIFGILNQDLEELPIHSNYPFAMFNERGFASPNAAYFFSEIEDSPKKVILDSNVVVITEFKKDERYTGEKKGRKSYYYGLLNYKTGERIVPQFHQVYRLDLDGKSYFWTMKYAHSFSTTGELTIYNSDLAVIFKSAMRNWSEHFQSSYYNCPDEKERMFVLQNAEGKFGGLNAKGEIVMPFQYAKAQACKIEREDESCPMNNWIVEKDGKNGVYSWRGKQLLPIEYDEVRMDQLGYIQLRKDSLWTLLDLNFNEMISKCSAIISSLKSAMNGQRVKPTYKGTFLDGQAFFAIKDGEVYFEDEGVFKKVDSTFLLFPLPLMSMGSQILVRKDGKALAQGDLIANIRNSIYLVRSGSDFKLYAAGTVPGLDAGEFLNRIKNAKTYDYNQNYIAIQLKNLRWGAYDLATGATLVEPNYYEIKPMHMNGKARPDAYWGALTSSLNYGVTDWNLVNGKGESLFSKVVDFPFSFNRANLAFFATDKKFGILDTSMTILVPAMYDQVIDKDSMFFLKKDGHWFGFRRETGVVDLKAEYISIDSYRNGYLLFGYQGIAIVDKHFKFVLPYTNTETAVQTLDLMKLVGISITMKNVYNPNSYYLNNSSVVSRTINNRHLLELAETRSTRYALANQNQYLTRYFDNGSFHINELRELDLNIVFYKNSYMSVKREKKTTYWQNFVQNSYSSSGITSTKNEYTTYRINETSYAVIELKDLFVGKSDYIKIVDDLLTTKINKRQLFGANCVNLATILSDYRKNFYLSEDGIVFCQPGKAHQSIVLTYKELGL
jgi:hypothetical protein